MTYCQLQRVNAVLPQYCYVRSQRIKQTRQLVISRVIQVSKYFQRGFTSMDNRVDQYCDNIVMSSLVSFQGNRGATIRNHVLVCLRTGLAEGTEWIRCFPPSEQVCCGRQLLYQCFTGEIEQRTSKFVDFFRPPLMPIYSNVHSLQQ